MQTAGVVAFYAVYSSVVLLVLTAVVDSPTPLLESATVAAASVLGGAGRFLLLRFWVFEPEPSGAPSVGERLVARWREHRRWTLRVAVAFLTGAALVLSTAGSCDAAGGTPVSSQTGY